MANIRVLIADDHAVLRQGLIALLAHEQDIQIIGEAADGQEAVDTACALQPDVVLMDIAMPHLNGVEATKQITKLNKQTKVLILSQYDSQCYVENVFRAGASGYLLKKSLPINLANAIRKIHQGDAVLDPQIARTVVDGFVDSLGNQPTVLTPRETEVLTLLADGHSNQETADSLCVSVNTVITHRAKLMAKLGLRNRTDMIKYAIKEGLVSLDE